MTVLGADGNGLCKITQQGGNPKTQGNGYADVQGAPTGD
jgi:hypothetical protein